MTTTATIPAERLPALLAAMPKAELHIHIEGSLEPELIFALAQRNWRRASLCERGELRRAYAFTNLQSFLDIYYAGASVLLQEQDFYDMAWAYLQRAAADKVVRAGDLLRSADAHGARRAMQTVIAGLSRACRDARAIGVDAELILCFLRHLSEEDAFETLEAALPFRDQFIGVGLDSSELGHPPEKFARVFAKCRQQGLHLVGACRRGRTTGYVWSALDVLKVERIDHGVQSTKDPALMKRLAQDRIPLTVCPLSNLKLCVFPRLEQHNLRELLDAGLCATVNSDDPAYFGGYMNANFLQTFAATGLGAEHAYRLARNSFEGSFAEASAKKRYIERLDAAFAAA
jgi:adenosine deaminase